VYGRFCDIGQVPSRNFDWLSFTPLVTFSGPSRCRCHANHPPQLQRAAHACCGEPLLLRPGPLCLTQRGYKMGSSWHLVRSRCLLSALVSRRHATSFSSTAVVHRGQPISQLFRSRAQVEECHPALELLSEPSEPHPWCRSTTVPLLHRHRHPLLGEPLLRWISWSCHCCAHSSHSPLHAGSARTFSDHRTTVLHRNVVTAPLSHCPDAALFLRASRSPRCC
jgi:hypothetical protein